MNYGGKKKTSDTFFNQKKVKKNRAIARISWETPLKQTLLAHTFNQSKPTLCLHANTADTITIFAVGVRIKSKKKKRIDGGIRPPRASPCEAIKQDGKIIKTRRRRVYKYT
jgi:hypothetical protein